MSRRYASLSKHYKSCVVDCDECLAFIVVHTLEVLHREFREFVDRTPGFIELIADNPGAMLQVIADETKESNGHFRERKRRCMINALAHLLAWPKFRHWREIIVKHPATAIVIVDNPFPLLRTLVKECNEILDLSNCIKNLEKVFND